MITTATLRRAADRSLWILWGYLLLVATAELLTYLVSPMLGLTLHSLSLIGLTVYWAMGRPGRERDLTLALTLIPLIRLLSLSLPLALFPQVAWYPIVTLPLLIAAWIIARSLRLTRQELGLRLDNPALQIMLAGGGLGLGVVEYGLLNPAPLFTTFSWGAFCAAALVLVVCTGFGEELIFRGLLLSLARPALRRWAMIYVSSLFAVMHIGYLSLIDVVFVFMVGMLFAYIVCCSGSILGVTLMHGLTNVTLFLIMPYLAKQHSVPVAAMAALIIWIGTTIGFIAAIILVARARAFAEADWSTVFALDSAPAPRPAEDLLDISAPRRKRSPARQLPRVAPAPARPAFEQRVAPDPAQSISDMSDGGHQMPADPIDLAIERISEHYLVNLRAMCAELHLKEDRRGSSARTTS